jgi:hypothetical protein
VTKSFRFVSFAALLAAGILAATPFASADSMFTVQYFAAPTSGSASSDFHNGNVSTGGISNSDYVKSTLINGNPVFFGTGFNSDAGAVSAPGANYLAPDGEILYWTAGQNGITSVSGPEPLTVSSDPSHPTEMFVPGQSNNSTDELTAILTGTFNLAAPGNVQFSVGADDEAFVYLDGNLIETIAGIHALSPTLSTDIPNLAAGIHTVQIFYADLDEVQAQLSFAETPDTSVTITPAVPEPSTFMLFGTGLLGAAGAIRRRLTR